MDKNIKPAIHNFHFVLNSKLKNKVARLSVKLKKNLSQTGLYILKITICILKKFHYTIEEVSEISRYPVVNWDVDMNIHIEEIMFREIKHVAGTMHAFSLSIIVRRLLEFYFYYLELSNGKTERVEKIFKRFNRLYVNDYGTKIRKWKKKILNSQLLGNFKYYLTFNDKFSLTGFNFNNSD